MKYLFVILFAILGMTVNAQVHVTKDASGNYIASVSKDTSKVNRGVDTGKKFTDAKGNTYTVYQSSRGSLFVIRTSRNGKEYKQYLKE